MNTSKLEDHFVLLQILCVVFLFSAALWDFFFSEVTYVPWLKQDKGNTRLYMFTTCKERNESRVFNK